MARRIETDFYIEIKFKKDSENPSRVFQTMAGIIDAFQQFDNDLIRGIDSKLEPVILLEDIEVSSLRAWLANRLKGVPDDAIRDLDWKKFIGTYLVKAKYIVIKKLEGKTEITDKNVIEDIQYELLEEAKKIEVNQLPGHQPMPLPKLIANIDSISKALEPLTKDDSAIITTPQGTASFNLELNFTPEHIEDLLTKESISSKMEMILKVKKPDYLGESKWDFKHGGRLIQVKITDLEWLNDFQNRKIDIRPGDSIRAKVTCTTKYGFDMEVVGVFYEVTSVIEVIPLKSFNQKGLFDEDEP